MKKNILIGVLTVISILSILFGYTQRNEADRQRIINEVHMKMLDDAKVESGRFQHEAELNLREAIRQEQIVQDIVKKNKERK